MHHKKLALPAALCFAAGVITGLLIDGGLPPFSAAAAGGDAPARPSKSKAPRVAEAPAPPVIDGKLRIICFGAHPDDCELQAGGTAALWAAAGHQVKFVSVTNGDIGHWLEAGGPLARRRTAEVHRAAEMLGISSEVLDNHDGELLPTLENRR